MPTSREPRIVIRLSAADHAVIEAAAKSAGVAVGALVRECAVRHAARVADDVAAGRLTMRRRAASSEPRKPEPLRPENRAEMFRRMTQRP